jgi:chromosome segregation protein
MRLHRLQLSGFRGFLHSVTIPMGRGFTIISGRNGAGKSSVCDAIEFALTGDIGRYASATEGGERISDYLWWRGTGTPSERYVELIFLDDNGVEYKVRRGPEGIDRASAERLKNLYEPALAPPDPINTLALTSVIRDEAITLLSTDLSEVERYEFVKRAVGLAGSLSIETKSDELLEELNRVNKESEGRYANVAEMLSLRTALLSETKSRASLVQDYSIADIEEAASQMIPGSRPPGEELLFTLTRATRETYTQILSFERLLTGFVQCEELRGQVEGVEYQERLRTIKEEIDVIRDNLDRAQKNDGELKVTLADEQKKHSRQVSLAVLIEHGKRVGLIDGACPLCGSKIATAEYDSHLATLSQELSIQNQNLVSLISRQASATDEVTEHIRKLAATREAYAQAEQLTAQLQARTARLAEEASKLGVEASNEGIRFRLEALRQRVSRLEELRSNLEAVRSLDTVNALERELDSLRKERDRAEKELENINSAKTVAERIKQTIKRTAGEVLDDKLAALNPLMTELYQRLKPHVEWQEIKYRMRGDVRRFLSLLVGADLNPRFIFSAGQRRALGLAFLLSVHMSRRWCKLRTLVLDDPVQHIDDYRALHLVETLSAINRRDFQLICTVEDSSLADLLVRRLSTTQTDSGIEILVKYEPGRGSYAEPKEVLPTQGTLLSA